MTVSCEHKVHSTNIRDIRWDAVHRTIAIGDATITLTPIQFCLFFPLLQGVAITYADLARMVYHCDVDGKVRKMIDKHIDRVRKKLRGTGVYIYCVLGYGYLLLDEVTTE